MFAFLIAPAAAAQDRLDELLRLTPPPVRSVEVVATAPRGAALTAAAVAPSDARFVYLGTSDGRVYASADGGATFDEVALGPVREPIYGAFRGNVAPNGAPFGVEDVLDPALSFGDVSITSSVNDLFDFPYGTSGESLLDAPAWWPAPATEPDLRQPPGRFTLTDVEAGDDGADLEHIGLGLLGPAARFEWTQLARGRRIARQRLKLSILFWKPAPASVAAIAVHPSDPRIALAAGESGLFRTTDGGNHWDVMPFGDDDMACRVVMFVDPRRVLLGAADGLYESTDGGARFTLAAGDADVRALAPGLAGKSDGLLRERGAAWLAEDAPGAVRSLAVTPKGPVWLATSKGLWRDATRVGASAIGRASVSSVTVDPADPGHVACVAEARVWESRDGGASWVVLPLDDSARSVAFEAGALRVLTASRLLRVRATPPAPVGRDRLDALTEHLRAEPSLTAVIGAALRAHGVHPDTWRDVRGRVWLAGLLPTLNVVAGVLDTTMHAGIDGDFLGPGVIAGRHGRAPYGFGGSTLITRDVASGVPWWGVYASWNLASLVFHEAELPIGPDPEQASQLYRELTAEVSRLYAERRAVLSRLVTAPPADAAAAIGLRLRLEEVTVVLDALSGGLYGPWIQTLERTPYFN